MSKGSSDPTPIFPVWLNKSECDQLVAVWEKQGILGSVVDKIKSSEFIKGTK